MIEIIENDTTLELLDAPTSLDLGGAINLQLVTESTKVIENIAIGPQGPPGVDGVSGAFRVVLGDFTFEADDFGIGADATGIGISGQLPAATGSKKTYQVYKMDNENTAAIIPSMGDTINGLSSITLTLAGDWIQLVDSAAGQWLASVVFSDMARKSVGNVFARANFFPTLYLNGRLVTTDDTITDQDFAIYADASGGSITLPLPPSGTGQLLRVKRIDSTDNSVSVVAQLGDLIDNSISISLLGRFSECWLYAPKNIPGIWDNMGAGPLDVDISSTQLWVPEVHTKDDLATVTTLNTYAVGTRLDADFQSDPDMGTGLKSWILRSGAADGGDPGQQAPNDYNGVDNDVHWESIA